MTQKSLNDTILSVVKLTLIYSFLSYLIEI